MKITHNLNNLIDEVNMMIVQLQSDIAIGVQNSKDKLWVEFSQREENLSDDYVEITFDGQNFTVATESDYDEEDLQILIDTVQDSVAETLKQAGW